ncbi:MAG: NAD-dependent epimerase/dehydratase family protein [Chthoniobacteraceae bacterium]
MNTTEAVTEQAQPGMAGTRNVLITGAAGFLGTYLARECVSQGARVFGTDRNAPGDPKLFDGFAVGPLADVNLGALLGERDLHACFHLAGAASVPASMKEPLADFSLLLPATARLLEFLVRVRNRCHVILFSSAAVYGNPASLPVSESAAVSPLSPYGAHKFLAEELLRHYARIYGIRGSALRIFSAYGDGLRRQLFWDVMMKYSDAVRSGEKVIRLLGTGLETRDFIHARDVARFAWTVGLGPADRAFQVVNVASGIETEVRSAVSLLLAASPVPVRIEFSGASRSGDPQHWRADMAVLHSLGCSPAVSLADGLKSYFEWSLGEMAHT